MLAAQIDQPYVYRHGSGSLVLRQEIYPNVIGLSGDDQDLLALYAAKRNLISNA
jgi:hypothetical protein